MSESKHTHGPWLWRDDVLFDENDKEIFCLPEIHRNLDRSVKCKIAAAPDLLAACETFVPLAISFYGEESPFTKQLCAAIKKAKGTP